MPSPPLSPDGCHHPRKEGLLCHMPSCTHVCVCSRTCTHTQAHTHGSHPAPCLHGERKEAFKWERKEVAVTLVLHFYRHKGS